MSIGPGFAEVVKATRAGSTELAAPLPTGGPFDVVANPARRLRLERGVKEHRTRPAIDPLFRSAARTCNGRVIGVLLSGLGEDGVSGLIAIKAAGGLSLVQDPREARYGAMPTNAITDDDVDAVLPAVELAASLQALVAGEDLSGRRPRRGAD